MLRNYFKTAFRSLWRNSSFTVINLAGLSVGIAGALLLLFWIQNELSFDQFHANKNTLYKVWTRTNSAPIQCWDITCAPLGPALKEQFPEIKSYTRVYWPTDRLFNYGNKAITGTGLDVDKAFLTMFSFPLIQGSSSHALDGLHSIVITQNLAQKIFRTTDPLNKLLRIDNEQTYTVTGVLKNLPDNTQFDFEYLVSIYALPSLAFEKQLWHSNSYNTYVQLAPHTDINILEAKIRNIIIRHDPTQSTTEIFLHPLSKWHLYSSFENGKIVGGEIETVHLFFIIASLILLIACINFMNLSTAQSEKRSKEVGVRKVIGASRFTLIGQFLTESILLSLLAGIIGLLLVQLSLKGFNQLVGKHVSIEYKNPLLWVGMLLFILFTGLLAGSYPAFFLSGFKPVRVLRGSSLAPVKVINPRKLLVIIQFTVAIILIVSSIIIYKQVNYIKARNTGYLNTNLIEHPINGDLRKNYEALKNELISSGAVTDICKTSFSFTVDGSHTSSIRWGNMNPHQSEINFSRFGTSGNFIKTAGLTLLEGRDIDLAAHVTDTGSVLINESALKLMNLNNPVGQKIFVDEKQTKTIVGVFSNFIIGSPYRAVDPMIVLGTNNWTHMITMRLNSHNSTAKNLKIAEQIFKKQNPAYPFQYKFIDQEYAEKYANEINTGILSALFSGLTILISCLGLFGLAIYTAESRSKEIGIRKVLGASVRSILLLLTKEFILLVVISILIATPLSWYFMNKWLQNYSYRIQISWFSFVLAGSIALVIALLTISVHSFKAARINPVKSIKDS